MYKFSFYNHIVVYNNQYLCYNFLNKSLVKINSINLLKYFNSDKPLTYSEVELLNDFSNKTFEKLILLGMLINCKTNEYEQYKFNYYKMAYSSDALYLYIYPTFDCNFNCPYCFQGYKKSKGKSDITQPLLNWIKKSLKNKSSLSISWNGGEPILGLKKIEEITEEIKKYCKINNINYKASMLTNGYLMNDIFIKKIETLNITNLIITIDGYEKYHDKTRSLKNGKPTFDKIIKNIESYIKLEPKNCKLKLRFNCTDDNFQSIFTFLDSFSDNFKARIENIVFQCVMPYNPDNNTDYSIQMRSNKEENLNRLYKYAIEKKWNVVDKTSIPFLHCLSDNVNTFSIDIHGNIHLCDHYTTTLKPFATIFDENTDLSKLNELAKWYSFKPFENSECKDCILLPQCGGGCRFKRSQGITTCINPNLQNLDSYVISKIIKSGY